MSRCATASTARANPQRTSSSTHVIWGGLETSSSDNSCAKFSEQEIKRRIMERKIDAGGIVLLSDSATDLSSGSRDDSGGAAKTDTAAASSSAAIAARPMAVADDDDEMGSLGPAPSVGSSAHLSGHCKPCLFLFEKVGCQYGAQCTFCHYPHSRRIGARQSKGKRERFKKLVAKVEAKQVNYADGPSEANNNNMLMSL